jgi:hypothetical protein
MSISFRLGSLSRLNDGAKTASDKSRTPRKPPAPKVGRFLAVQPGSPRRAGPDGDAAQNPNLLAKSSSSP